MVDFASTPQLWTLRHRAHLCSVCRTAAARDRHMGPASCWSISRSPHHHPSDRDSRAKHFNEVVFENVWSGIA